MTDTLDHGRYCTEVIEQTRLFREILRSAPLNAHVPSCPDWTLCELAVHLGNGHRWAAEIVRTRSSSFLPPSSAPGHIDPAEASGATSDAAALDAWLAGSAQLLTDELLAAGEDAAVWTFLPDRRSAFWARRRTHETLVHRADAALAAGVAFEADPVLAVDCVDEWLEIVSSRKGAERRPEVRALAERPGETLHLHATDAPEDLTAEWLISLQEDGVEWRHAHEKATVALRGPVTDVLRVFMRRLPPTSERVEVLGDAGLLDFWLDHIRF